MPVQTQILTRRGTAASWTSTNPTLGAGEIGYETDTGRFKIGTGAAAWASLGYFNRDPLTTKGDLYTFSTTDDRLAVGANGETIVADSSTSTGLRYQATPIVNPAINGAFDVFQRGTSTTVNNAWTFVADRWMGYRATSCTYSRQATGDTTNLPNIQYCIRMARTAGDTATGTMYLQQSVETANAIPFAGKTVTLSFWARKGADYSSTSNVLDVFLYTGTGTDQNVKDGYTGSATPINTTVTLTTTWQRFQVTGTIASTATEFSPYFTRGTAGTAGAADHCEITGVMVSIGSIAPSFRRSGGTIQGERSACQRYYFRQNANNASAYAIFGTGFANTANNTNIPCQFPVTMRVKPTSIDTSAMSTFAWEQGTNFAATPDSITLDSNYTSADSGMVAAVKASAFTNGIYYRLEANNNSGAFIGWSAEL